MDDQGEECEGLNGSQEQEHKASVDIEINKDIEVELKLHPRHVDPNPRRVYITNAVVEKFGGTDGVLVAQPLCSEGTGVAHNEQCRERIEKLMRKDPSEKERWCTATRRWQEFEEPRVGFMNHGENDPDEPVRKHARHEDGLTPGVSSTDPIGPQTPVGTGEEETFFSGHKRGIDEDRDESVTKVRRNGTGRGRDGDEDQEMLVIVDLMCEATEDHKEIDDYKKANLEESFDWDQQPRMSWADAHDEELQPKVYEDLTGHELDRNEVLKARLNEIEGLASMGVWVVALREQCIARTWREPMRGRWVDFNKGDDNNKVHIHGDDFVVSGPRRT